MTISRREWRVFSGVFFKRIANRKNEKVSEEIILPQTNVKSFLDPSPHEDQGENWVQGKDASKMDGCTRAGRG